jgi:ADP-ribosyl-[dinitrogen reductase] hydrolase
LLVSQVFRTDFIMIPSTGNDSSLRPINRRDFASRFAGVLLGTAVGDSLGLPAEGMTRGRIERRWHGHWRHRFIFGRGMISDDTEHMLMVAQALLSEPEDAAHFQRLLGWKLRWWFAALPAGVGMATAKACLRLWMGFPANKCAVRSAGSGPAMRSSIIGAYFADDADKRKDFVLACSRLTHRGWQAETAALAVAEVTAIASSKGVPVDSVEIFSTLRGLSGEEEWRKLIGQIESALANRESIGSFAEKLGTKAGISGYSLHVIAAAIYSWLRHPNDFRTALTALLSCGGDTDTAGAIFGAIAGAVGGQSAIPAEWIDGIVEWPRSSTFMRRLAMKLAEQKNANQPLGPVGYFWLGLIPRNLVFLSAVLIHGFRRLTPPF